MTTAYFLTGSFKDQDNDFEIKITIKEGRTTSQLRKYSISLMDLSASGAPMWQDSGYDFLTCLDNMEVFLSDNSITLYSKIRTSEKSDPMVDKELEGFILNHLEY